MTVTQRGHGFVNVVIPSGLPIAAIFRQLSPELQKVDLRATVLAGAKVLEAAAARAAPKRPGSTKKTRQVHSAIVGRGKQRHRVRLARPKPQTYDYGHLRDNIRHRRFTSTLVRAAMLVGIGRAFWGRFLELGTKRMKPHVWWAPAIRAAQPAMSQAMAQVFEKGIVRAVNRLAGGRK
jgi:HK97 gp10 family phage protein